MFIFPVASVFIEISFNKSNLSWPLIGKWFVFWAIGIRIFVAGIRQALNPEFTANEIFKINNEKSLVVIRELGFANICIGLIGILSLINTEWCKLGAIAGGLFLGLASIQHLSRKPDSKNEIIATISNAFIFVIMLLYLFETI